MLPFGLFASIRASASFFPSSDQLGPTWLYMSGKCSVEMACSFPPLVSDRYTAEEFVFDEIRSHPTRFPSAKNATALSTSVPKCSGVPPSDGTFHKFPSPDPSAWLR